MVPCILLLPDSFLHKITCKKLNALIHKQPLALNSNKVKMLERQKPAVYEHTTPVTRAV